MRPGSLEVPNKLPLLPLRDVVLFPGIGVPLFVGRPRSIAAVDAALTEERLFLAVTQKRPEHMEPRGKDLFRVGTVGIVREHGRLPDGTVRIVATGLCRARLGRLDASGDHLTGTLSLLSDPDPGEHDAAALFIDLRHEVLERFQEYVSLRDRVPDGVLDTAVKLADPSEFSLFVAGHIAAGVVRRQRILETDGWLPRLRLIADILETENRELEALRSLPKALGEARFGTQAGGKRSVRVGGDTASDDEDELDELRRAVDRAKLPEAVHAKATREVSRLARMNAMSPEATVSRTYVDWLLALPWTKRTDDQLDLAAAQKILDEDHHGLRPVKDRILEHMAVVKLSKSLRGPVLCLVGPPGVGKTSLGRSIARAMGRTFVRMSLGGVRDEAEIRGHRRTYIGSMPGRIIQSMRRAGSVNPLILLDEIDKMGADYRGDPAAAMLEVLDPEQNHMFQDHYLDVDYDLSNVMFVTTSNSLAGIHPALLDRMEVLRLPGYLEHEKLAIVRGHLLPRQRERCGLSASDIEISDEALLAVIRERTREAGVRGLEREVAALCRKAARRQADGSRTGPLVVEPTTLDSLLGAARFGSSEIVTSDRVGVATGLAWTEVGGEILTVEVALLPGRGRLLLTGRLGETMRESGQAALSYIRSRSGFFGLDPDFSEHLDVHVHLAQGGVPKDGPSAGVTLALAMVSALTGTPTSPAVALTGEITLRGTVLPVGGLAEKLMAARRAGVATVLVPEENTAQIVELPSELTRGIRVIPVRTMDEVIEYGLDGLAEGTGMGGAAYAA